VRRAVVGVANPPVRDRPAAPRPTDGAPSSGRAPYRGDVERLLLVAAVASGLWLLGCLAMVLLAARLPGGLLKQVLEFLPACVTTARRLRAHPDVPRRAKVALLVAIIWVVSPIDLLPEFLPVIGPLDDVVAVVLLLRYAARSVPRDVLLAAWPSDPALLERLLGRGPVTGTDLESH